MASQDRPAQSRGDERVGERELASREPVAGGAEPSQGSAENDGFDAKNWLAQATGEIRDNFARNRRVMSFPEYLALFGADPAHQLRSAGQYLRDVFDYFGSETVRTPRGPMTHWRLFDCPWDGGKDALAGHEEVQGAVYRLVSNFAREGRTNRLILLHGPNGSAKSTFVACLQRGMEHYSTLDEGALYKFNWIFPSQKLTKGGIGFGGGFETGGSQDSFAYLDDELIESKISDEMRDHPLLLVPRNKRRDLIGKRLSAANREGFKPADYFLRGDLSHRNRQIFEALLSSYHGDLAKVLRHVQVERFFVSRRYRQAAATVEPQLAVDARSRQLTMDRSLGSLPPALQSLTLYEYQGELVDGNRGVIEFADLLKRPLEAYKYLLGTVEQGRVSLDVASLELDTVFIGSSNEGYLAAFKETPDFQSFKGRMELVRVPYLLDYRVEQKIYEAQIRAAHAESGRHVAPHVSWVTALWSVLTRMRKPLAEKYGKALSDIVVKLGPLEKAQLYAESTTPDGLSSEQQRDLLAGIEKVARESDSYPNYEGRTGASPREMKLLIMNAAQSPRYACLSPFAMFDELEELVRAVTVYEFLKQEPLPGGFHENRKFIFQVRDRLIERILEVSGKRDEFRREVISRIGAWSVDHPRQKPDYERIFPRPIIALRDAFFEERKKQVRKINEDLLVMLTDGPDRMQPDAAAAATTTLNTMKSRYGYCDNCAKDAVLALIRKRYS